MVPIKYEQLEDWGYISKAILGNPHEDETKLWNQHVLAYKDQ